MQSDSKKNFFFNYFSQRIMFLLKFEGQLLRFTEYFVK